MSRIIFAVLLCIVTGRAEAGDTRAVLTIARELGTLKSAEVYCGFTFDQREMNAQFSRNSDDIRIFGWMEQYEREALNKQATMAPEPRRLYCFDVEQIARRLNVIK